MCGGGQGDSKLQQTLDPPTTPITTTTTLPPSQMIAELSYEKRKGLFLINMWEVDFPCKAGLLRRKVHVCPLCTAGLCRKRVWFCRRLCLHLGYFRWPLQGERGWCLLLYRCKEIQEERCDCMHMNACACVWQKKLLHKFIACSFPEVRGQIKGKKSGHRASAIKERQQSVLVHLTAQCRFNECKK